MMLAGLWGPKAGKASFWRKAASGRVRVNWTVWGSRAVMVSRREEGGEIEEREEGEFIRGDNGETMHCVKMVHSSKEIKK
jgi:hypothetical protein